MTTRLRKLVPVLLLAGALAGWAIGCKQGEGDRCQVNDDCESPLVCNQATQTCSTSSGGGLDASLPIDAPLDSPPDSPPDTTVN